MTKNKQNKRKTKYKSLASFFIALCQYISGDPAVRNSENVKKWWFFLYTRYSRGQMTVRISR